MTEDRESDGHCYRFYDTPESWMQAESTCQTWGSHLIAVQNEAKQVGTGVCAGISESDLLVGSYVV